MEVKDVFSASPKSVWEFLCENGQGLYIPAYQRQYSWDKSKIQRLIEDAWHGFSLLINQDDAITFLGAIIAIHDTQLLTVNPLVRGDVPSKVMTIIDGQQRLTTLVILDTILHEEISIQLGKLKDTDCGFSSWLKDESLKVKSRLNKTFEEDKDYGDDEYRYYPRMIRAYEDSWSRKKSTASYESPVGKYLHEYGKYLRLDSKKAFTLALPNNNNSSDKFNLLSIGRKHIMKMVRSLSKDNETSEFSNLESILSSKSLQQILLQAEVPDEVKEFLLDNKESNGAYLFRLVLFANFVLDRIAVTIVTAKNEDYAFDMFESLNTTGEPLTAFETFKPRVIYFEGIADYESSVSFGYLSEVEKYLEKFSSSNDKKQNETSKLVVNFALAETGAKVSKRLNDQRKFFKDSFDGLAEIEEQRCFVKHLADTSAFMLSCWPEAKTDRTNLSLSGVNIADSVFLCIEYLRQFNHSITISLMVRYFSSLRKENQENILESYNEFEAIVKAIAAFSTFWRASRRGTDGIDNVYRTLMDDGCPEVGLEPLARQKASTPPTSSLVKKALIFILESKGGINNKEDWCKIASTVPAYKNQPAVARFILLASSHDTVDDPSELGLLKAGKAGTLDLFNSKEWLDEQSQTVEHVAPQQKSSSWDDDLYENAELIHRLGNLTLLPGELNSSISNAPWAKKSLCYKVLAAKTETELQSLLLSAKTGGVDIPNRSEDLLAKSKFLPLVSSISLVNDWKVDLVNERSRRICSLAWDRIRPWLD
jgi:uncharacterized protein with ParB-like and HNH nuclease domain